MLQSLFITRAKTKCQKTFNAYIEFCNVKFSWINASCWDFNNQEIEIDSSLHEKTQSLVHNDNHQDTSSNPLACGCLVDLFTQLPNYYDFPDPTPTYTMYVDDKVFLNINIQNNSVLRQLLLF